MSGLTYEEYYGANYSRLLEAQALLTTVIRDYPKQGKGQGIDPILYCSSRIKEPESMIQKLKGKKLAFDGVTAIQEIHDALGVRIVCSFLDDVYDVSHWLMGQSQFRVIEVKDYIAHPKPNGYRSLHLIAAWETETLKGLTAEIQIRTIALDFWAALEHQIKYKRKIAHEKTVREELKRCADEIASMDLSMETLRELIQENCWEPNMGEEQTP